MGGFLLQIFAGIFAGHITGYPNQSNGSAALT